MLSMKASVAVAPSVGWPLRLVNEVSFSQVAAEVRARFGFGFGCQLGGVCKVQLRLYVLQFLKTTIRLEHVRWHSTTSLSHPPSTHTAVARGRLRASLPFA